ncbi:hypothetical protein MKJ01_11440 [Chryseobacterium sp. SSA4.19]|uniref:MNIO class RiPP chryseobasin precursor ChrA n=1 Tax=Chryseobacterium sp. SSA4.19 TaxID=2919915 RepID=UPI001F4E7313|nr:hypothetical protein [Chryseobacterium sp. SSA4.19]MCJ8154374.1 hypothetical protein [Chryseobacterium sp. SSA4.19]
MKIPAALMVSLLTVSLSAQTTKPITKKVKKVTKKTSTVPAKKPATAKTVVQKDTVVHHSGYCPACGMG